MEGVVLGSGGWFPTSTRQTCSALLRQGSNVLVIDAGTGIQRILERPDLVEGAETVDIVLTHFHLDHVVGLSCLPGLPLSRPPVVWGPGEFLLGVPTRSILERLLGRPLFTAPFSSIVRDVREFTGEELVLGPFALSMRVQERHSDPTLAFRVGDALTYCTDTAPDPGNVTFAEGSHVLLHEAWYVEDHDDTHSAGGDGGRIAREAGVRHLVLIHVNPLNESDEDLAASARAEFPGAQVGTDLATIPMP
jgi:ribonuclease BN (tRNA processing enzyme)